MEPLYHSSRTQLSSHGLTPNEWFDDMLTFGTVSRRSATSLTNLELRGPILPCRVCRNLHKTVVRDGGGPGRCWHKGCVLSRISNGGPSIKKGAEGLGTTTQHPTCLRSTPLGNYSRVCDCFGYRMDVILQRTGGWVTVRTAPAPILSIVVP